MDAGGGVSAWLGVDVSWFLLCAPGGAAVPRASLGALGVGVGVGSFARLVVRTAVRAAAALVSRACALAGGARRARRHNE